MKFEFVDKGAVATLTITSNVLEIRKHNRVVDAVQLSGCIHVLPSSKSVVINRSGLIFMKTVISGYTPTVMACYKAVAREAAK